MIVQTVVPLTVKLAGTRRLVSSPRLENELAVEPEIIELLMLAQAGIDSETGFTGVALTTAERSAAVAQLLSLGFLRETCPAAPEDTLPTPWDAWGGDAWAYHRSTLNANYLYEPGEILEYAVAVGNTPPPVGFGVDEQLLLLPRVWSDLDALTFKGVLEQRRSHRTFGRQSVALDSLSTLLHYGFGPLRFAECNNMGVLELRAYASAGARHEITAYVVVFDVAGLAPGVYRYDQITHGLILLDGAQSRDSWEELTFRQTVFETGSFAVVIVSDAHGMSWKYRHPRAYRHLIQNVGHAAQVFAMTACALELGCAVTGAFRDDAVTTALRIERPELWPMFVMVVGHPVVDESGFPLDLAPPLTPWRPQQRSR